MILLRAGLVFLALTGATALRAHDIYEITAEAWVKDDHIEVSIMMARRTAIQACAIDLTGRTFTGEDDFDNVREDFEKAARSLFLVTVGDQTLMPREARVILGGEGDLEFKVIYPRPPKGPLVFNAVHLQRFEDPTYGVVLTAQGDRVFLGQELLRATEPVMEIPLPVEKAEPETAQAQSGAAP